MKFWVVVTSVISFIITSLFLFSYMEANTVKIGLLYSKTGTMQAEEKAIAQAIHYQVEQVNKQGGILGRKIKVVEYDGASSDVEFARGAQYLVDQEVDTIFGCWTSASRKAVKPIIEKSDALLFYPVQYEGVERSKNIIYLGATPSQQVNLMMTYIQKNFGSKVLVVGSNYIYPRMSALYLSEMANLVGMEVLAQYFIPLGSDQVESIMTAIESYQPDAIVNFLNGDSNRAFFKALHQINPQSEQIPVFSTSMDERSIQSLINHESDEIINGHFLVGSYFESIDSKLNSQLLVHLRQRYGADFLMTDAAYNSLIAFDLWASTVRTQQSFEVSDILQALKGQNIHSASGIIYIDLEDNHVHKSMRIGQLFNGKINIVWQSSVLARPNPFPIFKPQSFWANESQKLFKGWQYRWQSNDVFVREN